jgi:non-ribosomal peptide synthase protein (TIGR01720 family)
MMMTDVVPAPVDLLGVGFGPSNLAVAIAAAEHNATGPAAQVLRARFVERQEAFGWHRGMLIDDATMQVSFLKDLVTLRNPPLDALDTDAARWAISRVREHVDGLPDGGLGYGMLRHLNPRTEAVLAALDGPQLEFNYLGRFGYDDEADWAYTVSDEEAAEVDMDAGMPVGPCLDVNALTMDLPGGPELSAHWSWPGGVLDEDAVRDLAQTWLTERQTYATRTGLSDVRIWTRDHALAGYS